MAAYLSARQAANLCGVSERTIRNWIASGKLSAEKSAGTFRLDREQLEAIAAPGMRTSAPAERNGADSAAPDNSVVSVELVRLLAKLQEENRVMAGRIGWLEAQACGDDARPRPRGELSVAAVASQAAALIPWCAGPFSKEVRMIITDTSFVPLPGKDAEAVAGFKEIAAHFDTRWPLAVPRQVLVDLTGEAGRIHLIATKASLAEHERQAAEQGADETVRALAQKVTPLAVPGSRRDELRRVA